MKYLILSTSGRQTVIKPNRWYDTNLIKNAKEGDFIAFNRVYMYRNEKGIQVGKPLLLPALIVAKVVQHIKGKKLVILKTKPKKNYTRTTGHRSQYTRLHFPTF